MIGRQKTSSDVIAFREEQRPWVGFLVIGVASCLVAIGVFAWAMIQQLVFREPFSDRPMSDTALAIFGPVIIIPAVAGMIVTCMARLIIEVRCDGLYVQFRPFHLRPKKIDLDRAISVTVVRYRPILRYGGWGIRWAIKGKAYNAHGNRGVRVNYTNGRHLLLGSQRPDELAGAIERLRQQPHR
jgi:hypothetical protein